MGVKVRFWLKPGKVFDYPLAKANGNEQIVAINMSV